MKKSGTSWRPMAGRNHNGSQPVRHTYALGGLLRCGRCSGPIEGRSGTGKLGVRYYYYVCRDKECGIRVAANEVEGAVLARLGELASDEGTLERLAAETNKRLQRQVPELVKRRQELEKSHDKVNRSADRLLTRWDALDDEVGNSFVRDKLSQLAQRRHDLEAGIEELDGALRAARQQAVEAGEVRQAMVNINEVYSCLKPFEQKELMQLILKGAEVNERELVLEIRAGSCLEAGNTQKRGTGNQGEPRFERPDWLPAWGEIRTFFSFKIVAQIGSYAKRTPGTSYRFLGFGHLHDTLPCLVREADPRKPRRNPVALAQEWQQRIDSGEVPSRAGLARELGLSRAYVTLVLRLLQLEPSVQEVVLALGDPVQGRHVGVHRLRSLAMLQASEQEWRVMALINGTISRT